MKFCKTYEDYVQRQLQMELPVVEFKNLKKILKHCHHGNDVESQSDHSDQTLSACPHQCPVCDGAFFPELVKEMSAIVGSFNKQAERLLEAHLATGFKRYYLWLWCKGKMESNQGSLIQEGQELVTYAMINAVAMRKILKKYDKVHCSKQGQTFKSQIQRMHIEILQSPWLCELIAFHINLRERDSHDKKKPTTALFEGCNLRFVDGKPSLTCELFDSIKLDIDLTCSICLDTVFEPVALTCGHIFCHTCACSAASVTIVDGLSEASPKEKCPLCREARVFRGFVHLEELKILLSRRCPEYWEQRLQDERAERIRQAKQHWENQCRNFVGI